MYINIQPAAGKSVPFQGSMRLISADGARVKDSPYYRRLLLVGDLIFSESQAPTAPGGPVVTPQAVGVKVSATVAASTDNVGVAGYDWHLDGSSNAAQRTSSNSATFDGLTVGAHTLKARSFDESGNLSAFSANVDFSVPQAANVLEYDVASGIPYVDGLARVGSQIYIARNEYKTSLAGRLWEKAALKAFMAQPFETRTRLLQKGAFGYFNPIDLSRAIRVNGSTDVELQAALDEAHNAARTQRHHKIVLLNQDVTLAADVTGYSDIILTSNGVAEIKSTTDKVLIVPAGMAVLGVATNNSNLALSTAANGASKAMIVGCEKRGTVSGANCLIYDSKTTDNSLHREMTIALNKCDNEGDGILWNNWVTDSLIERNWYKNDIRTEGRAFRSTSNIGNIYRYNWIDGGITGIGNLVDKQNNTARGFYNTLYYCNWLFNISEEALSLCDIQGNLNAANGIIESGVVASVTGFWNSNPKLVFNRVDAALIDTTAQFNYQRIGLLVLTGTYAGKYLTPVGVGVQTAGTSCYVQLADRSLTAAELSGLVGARFVLVVRADNNIVAYNEFDRCWRGIYLHGMGWNNEIFGNELRRTPASGVVYEPLGDICLIGVGGIDSSSSYDPTYQVSMPAGNRIYNNDCALGVGFSGRAYSADATHVTPYIDPLPNYVAGNTGAVTREYWFRPASDYNTSGVKLWESTEYTATVTTDSSEFDPDFSGLPVFFDDAERKRENSDVYTGAGDGTTTVFTWPHYLSRFGFQPITPNYYSAVPLSQAAAGAHDVTVSTTHITVTFASAPSNGASVKFAWSVRSNALLH